VTGFVSWIRALIERVVLRRASCLAMDIRAALTVVGDGPVGAISQQLDAAFGLPEGHRRREWGLGMKMVVDLPESADLAPVRYFHTIGYPEPEIFGFFYVHPGRVASGRRLVPSWVRQPGSNRLALFCSTTSMHPYLWRFLEGGPPAVVGR